MRLTPLEASALGIFRRHGKPPAPTGDERVDWAVFGLSVSLQAARILRGEGPNVDVDEVDLKGDGSPVTELDHAVERMVRDALIAFHPETAVIGEEGGGELPSAGLAIAIDPIDGTWAYVSGTGTAATTLAVFEDGNPFFGLVANPSTGEIGYTAPEGEGRLVRLSVFGESDHGFRLPLGGADPSKVLVNVQPSTEAVSTVGALYSAWVRRRVQLVRSPGGSPAWALLEAAKGRFSYVNLWSDRPAKAFDLASGVLLVRAAGGEVTDLDGTPIDPVHHAGPFVAGIQPAARSTLLEIVRDAIG